MYKCVGLMGTSVSARWLKRFFKGGFFGFRILFKIESLSRFVFGEFKVCTSFVFDEIKVCARLLALLGCGGGV